MMNTFENEEDLSAPRDEDKEKFDELSKEWSKIYGKFKKDFEKLQKKAGGKEKLYLTNYGSSIYGFVLCLE